MGLIISNTLSIWHCIQKHISIDCKYHELSPIRHNNSLLSGCTPFIFPQWSKQGIYVLGDIFNNQGLRSLQDLREHCSLPGSSCFFYLKLRTALKSYGVPWDAPLPQHPLVALITAKTKLVAAVYNKLSTCDTKLLPVTKSWEKEFRCLNLVWNCSTVLNTVFSSSKNMAHQLIHYKFVHKFYFTPVHRFKLKLIYSDLCTKCPGSVRGGLFTYVLGLLYH